MKNIANVYEIANLSNRSIYLNTPALANLGTTSYFVNAPLTVVIDYLGR